jgi:hypothetical protein
MPTTKRALDVLSGAHLEGTSNKVREESCCWSPSPSFSSGSSAAEKK